MNAIRPIAVKLDQDTRDRLKRLADAKDRSTHWMLREAVAQFVEREEKREAFRQAGFSGASFTFGGGDGGHSHSA